jgi:ABC-type lipoprotein release transport system permease subunit
MRTFLDIAGTGLAAVLLHPVRSCVTVAALFAVLLPYLVGLGMSRGLRDEAEASVHFGADLYVTGNQFGREVPVPLSALKAIAKIDGVTEVTPRIVGGLVLGKEREPAVLVGLPPGKFPPSVSCVAGRLPRAGKVNELVIGTGLAHKLRLEVGSLLPPFYHNARGERLSKVVGVFRPDVSHWQTNLVFTSFDTAAAVFDQRGLATDVLVWCRPGYQDQVREAILQTVSLAPGEKTARVRPRVLTRQDLEVLLPSGLVHREGVFTLHFLLAFAVGILVVLVTSGFGHAGRRREIGILKATGWQTDEILLRGLVENSLLGLAAAALAVVGAFLWLRVGNGYWVAGIFLPGVGVSPPFEVPFRLAPVPVLLAVIVSLVVVMTGTLYSTWRVATVPPWQALR